MNDRPNNLDPGEARLGAALRASPEARERPSAALHGRIMASIERESLHRGGAIEFFRPLLALAAVAALAAGVTFAMVASRADRARAEDAREFVRVTQSLTESARSLERRIFDRASDLLIEPVERQARELGGDARAMLDRVREAMPERQAG